tara:strand:+ start:934 stop:1137 length:204 start_codon:yes stop_codon:yes gene_type:complete
LLWRRKIQSTLSPRKLTVSKFGNMNKDMAEAVKGIVSGDKNSLGKALAAAKKREVYLSARRRTDTEE